MAEWIHRERVLAVLNHEQPDRVPLDMMGNATMLLDATYIRLRDHLGLPAIAPVRTGTTANYYDERILEYLDIDFRRIFLKPASPPRDGQGEENSCRDAWGVRYEKQGPYMTVVHHPLREAKEVRDVEEYPWPRPEEMFTAEGLAAEAKLLSEETDYALVARNPLSKGFIDRARQLMGTAELLMALTIAPQVVRAILRHLLHIYVGVYDLFLDAVGPYVHIVETADDIGMQDGLLISPQMYRQFIKPLERELYSCIRVKAPHAAILRHTDGAVFELIPDFIEVGIGALNPTQTSARGMNADRLKRVYGQSLITFHGAIEKTAGPLDNLLAEVREKIGALAPVGGYILASCNHMMDVPPEHILAMCAAAHEYGKY